MFGNLRFRESGRRRIHESGKQANNVGRVAFASTFSWHIFQQSLRIAKVLRILPHQLQNLSQLCPLLPCHFFQSLQYIAISGMVWKFRLQALLRSFRNSSSSLAVQSSGLFPRASSSLLAFTPGPETLREAVQGLNEASI